MSASTFHLRDIGVFCGVGRQQSRKKSRPQTDQHTSQRQFRAENLQSTALDKAEDWSTELRSYFDDVSSGRPSNDELINRFAKKVLAVVLNTHLRRFFSLWSDDNRSLTTPETHTLVTDRMKMATLEELYDTQFYRYCFPEDVISNIYLKSRDAVRHLFAVGGKKTASETVVEDS